MTTKARIEAFKIVLEREEAALAPSQKDGFLCLWWMVIMSVLLEWICKSRTYKYFRARDEIVLLNAILDDEGDRP